MRRARRRCRDCRSCPRMCEPATDDGLVFFFLDMSLLYTLTELRRTGYWAAGVVPWCASVTKSKPDVVAHHRGARSRDAADRRRRVAFTQRSWKHG